MVDNGLAVPHGDSRTSQLHAHLTSDALVVVNFKGRVVLYVFEEGAGASGNNDRSLISGKLLLDSLLALSQVVGVNDSHTLDADSLAELFEVDSGSRVALQVLACGRVLRWPVIP